MSRSNCKHCQDLGRERKSKTQAERLQEPAGYWIEDTSTNGTVVNNQRVGKLCSCPLAEGDRVQLSWNAVGDPATILEYVPARRLLVD